MIVYIIFFSSFFVLYYLTRIIFLKLLLRYGYQNVSVNTVNTVAGITSVLLLLVPTYIYLQSILKPTDDLMVSNFRLEKSVRLLSPNFTDHEKIDEDFYVYYSFDIKNNVEDIKNFKLMSYVKFDNFNNMGDFKELLSFVYIYRDKKIVEFDDINLFKSGETHRVYGVIELNDEKIKWIKDKIPFETKIRFVTSGGTSEDDLKFTGKDVENNVDLTNFQEFVLQTYNDPQTITLEYIKKDEFSSTTLKNNLWTSKRKKQGKRDSDSITSLEILEYLFIDK